MTVYEGNRFEFVIPNLTYIFDPSYKVRTQINSLDPTNGNTSRRVENPLWMNAQPNSFRNVKSIYHGDAIRTDPYWGVSTTTPTPLPGGNYATKSRINVWFA